jgi:hypothetical protein
MAYPCHVRANCNAPYTLEIEPLQVLLSVFETVSSSGMFPNPIYHTVPPDSLYSEVTLISDFR